MVKRVLASLGACFCGCAMFAATGPQPGPGVFFVATNGNDAWSGSLPAPNDGRTDGPFATPKRALEATRELKRKQPPAQRAPLSIYLRQGIYFLEQTLVLTPEDSGLNLAAYPDERPVLSGGRPISGWKGVIVRGKKMWAVELPGVREGKWFFRELWIGDQRMERARYPKQGYLRVAAVPDKTAAWGEGHNRFQFKDGDIPPLTPSSNVEAVVATRWIQSRLPMTSVDHAGHILNFSKRTARQISPGDAYYLEGAFEFLEQPGEWDLDRTSGTLYYIPRPEDRARQTEAIAPVLTSVLELEGRPANSQFITGVAVRGVFFSHSEWYFPEGYRDPTNEPDLFQLPKAEVGGLGQSALGLPAAVRGKGLHDCLFEDCGFVHVGSYGLELNQGCQHDRVIHCLFDDLGGGGIRLGEPAIRAVPLRTGGNEISRCTIRDGGKMYTSAEGLWLGQTPDNRILHNEISDFYYTAMSLGATWAYMPTLTTNNLIEFNHIHHIGRKSNGDGPFHSDMGGIYTVGPSQGTILRNNRIHDITGLSYGGLGIYFDEATSGVLAENNLVYRTTDGSFHQHFGATNILRNNIFAFGQKGQLMRTKSENHLQFTLEHNIVYYDSGPLFGNNWRDDHFVVDYNLYWDTRAGGRPSALVLGPGTWDQWRAQGYDVHSIIADPHFVDPPSGNFQLQSDSPAARVGFKPFDLSTVGP